MTSLLSPGRRTFLYYAIAASLSFSGCGSRESDGEDAIKGPASAEQAARILDLSTFPLMEGAETPQHRTLANLSYRISTDIRKAFEFQRQQLTAQKWKESRDTTFTDQTASGFFTRGGFVVSVSAFPDGSGKVAISLHNHGNTELTKLPRPDKTKAVYEGDATAMYVTDASVEETKSAVRKLLSAEGWQPYGSAGDTQSFKQNAILVGAMISSAPAQGGKTMINYSSELMSADLPAPENAQGVRYADTTKELSFESPVDKESVVAFYKQALAKSSWQPTLEHTVDIDEKPTMIFRNPTKDMLTLSFSRERSGVLPVSLQHQSAAEIEEIERRIKAKMPEIKAKLEAKRKAEEAAEAEKHKPLPKVTVTLPNDMQGLEQSKDSIKFTVGKGKARGIVENWRKQFTSDGWKEDVATMDPMAGAVSLSKDRQNLTINYTDTGFMPAEVNVSAMGAEFETSR